MSEAAWTLVGVALGGAIGLVGPWWQRKSDRRKEIGVAATELVCSARKSWNAISLEAMLAIGEQDAKERGLPVDGYRKEGGEASRKGQEHSEQMACDVARLEVLCPALSVAAEELVRASDRATVRSGRDLEAGENAHRAARTAFLVAVAKQTKPKGAGRRWWRRVTGRARAGVSTGP